MTQNPRKGLTGDELLAKLDRWLEAQSEPPSIFEVVRTRDVDLLAGFVLRGFRAAARQAVIDKIAHYVGGSSSDRRDMSRGAVARLVVRIAREWSLDTEEQRALLGLENSGAMVSFRDLNDDVVTTEAIERASYLLDIFVATNALLSDPDRAAQWLRKPNMSPLFNGASPLERMMEGLEQLRLVKRFVQAEAWGA